jgi:Mn-dependent DtxR family transcriptional regulator
MDETVQTDAGQKLSASLEDYLEAIFNLADESEGARSKDIADVAQQAACKAEHALGPEIIGRLLSFIQYVTESHKNGRDVADEFRQFHKRRSGGKAGAVRS